MGSCHIQDFGRCFGRIPTVMKIGRQPPTNLYAGCEVCIKTNFMQTYISDKTAGILKLDSV